MSELPDDSRGRGVRLGAECPHGDYDWIEVQAEQRATVGTRRDHVGAHDAGSRGQLLREARHARVVEIGYLGQQFSELDAESPNHSRPIALTTIGKESDGVLDRNRLDDLQRQRRGDLQLACEFPEELAFLTLQRPVDEHQISGDGQNRRANRRRDYLGRLRDRGAGAIDRHALTDTRRPTVSPDRRRKRRIDQVM